MFAIQSEMSCIYISMMYSYFKTRLSHSCNCALLHVHTLYTLSCLAAHLLSGTGGLFDVDVQKEGDYLLFSTRQFAFPTVIFSSLDYNNLSTTCF